MERQRIVIIGAGFGGMYVAGRLLASLKKGEIELTLINRANYFLFTPLLHEVATGGLSPTSVTEPLREIFAGSSVRIRQGEVEAVDAVKRLISIARDPEPFPYDYAIVATGAVTNYYGVTGAEEHGLPLKSLGDAVRIRGAVIEAFERAAMIEDPASRARQLSFVVVGGGATGVEVAAELLEFASGMERRYHRTRRREEGVSVTLLTAGSELLAQFHPELRRAAENRLKRLGVRVRLNAAVARVEADRVVFSDDSWTPSSVVVWAAGVRPELPRFIGGAPAALQGRLRVDRFLRSVDDPRLFALGDAASVEGSQGDSPLPMLAQVAVAQAKTVASNVLAEVRGSDMSEFRYRSKGGLVSLGQWFAVGEILNARMSGRMAWWVWRTIYLFKFISWKKRLRIAFEWTINIFSARDITELD